MIIHNLLFMGGIGWGEILIILFVLLLLFGGKKIPELARGLGRGIREFKDAANEIKSEVTKEIESTKPEQKN